MRWNECLFWYAQARGGTCFGIAEEEMDGCLLLPGDRGSVLISARVASAGRYGVEREICASLHAELERPYSLEIGPESMLRGGWNTMLEALDRGAERLGRDQDLHRDYGVPELAARRKLKGSDETFTQWVLRSRELRQLLDRQPKLRVQVGPVGPASRVHLVSARTVLDCGGLQLSAEDWVYPRLKQSDAAELERRRAFYEASGVQEQLDALVELARTVRDAVTAWPMPMETGKG